MHAFVVMVHSINDDINFTILNSEEESDDDDEIAKYEHKQEQKKLWTSSINCKKI